MQTILGPNGPIGKQLAKELTIYTQKIRLVSRNPQKINSTDETISADITIPHELNKSIEGSEIVYFTVGFPYNYTQWKLNWMPAMQNVIHACKYYGAKLVFFDNIYMYDRNHLSHMTEETPVRPTSRKGEIRAEVAQLLWNEFDKQDVDGLIARSADFIGPRNSLLVELVYNSLKKNKKANWLADASKIHSFTNTHDAAKGTAILGNTPEAYNQIWHLPTDPSPITGKQWIELFAKTLDVKPKIREIPLWMLSLMGIFNPILKEFKEMGYQYDRDYFFDSSKFTKHFNYTPYTPKESVNQVISQIK